MASAMKNNRIDSDSVVYEHIIPRSVRRTWVRRSSVNSFDQDSFPVGISKELSTDTDFISRDAHAELGKEKEQSSEPDHITQEDEIAVFNAWGVKLRHVNRKPSPSKEIKPDVVSTDVSSSKQDVKNSQAIEFENDTKAKNWQINESGSDGKPKNSQINELKLNGKTKTAQAGKLISNKETANLQVGELKLNTKAKKTQIGEIGSKVKPKSSPVDVAKSSNEAKDSQVDENKSTKELKNSRVTEPISKKEQADWQVKELRFNPKQKDSLGNDIEFGKKSKNSPDEELKSEKEAKKSKALTKKDPTNLQVKEALSNNELTKSQINEPDKIPLMSQIHSQINEPTSNKNQTISQVKELISSKEAPKSQINNVSLPQKEPLTDNTTVKDLNYSKVSTHKQTDSVYNSPKVVDAPMKIKRERPKSMPTISSGALRDLDKAVDSVLPRQGPPKAYKSPHSKVPWKRPVNVKQSPKKTLNANNTVSTVSNDKNITNMVDNEILNRNAKNVTEEEKDDEMQILPSKIIKNNRNSRNFNDTKDNTENELLSVFKRRMSFEKGNTEAKERDFQKDEKHSSGKEVKQDLSADKMNGGSNKRKSEEQAKEYRLEAEEKIRTPPQSMTNYEKLSFLPDEKRIDNRAKNKTKTAVSDTSSSNQNRIHELKENIKNLKSQTEKSQKEIRFEQSTKNNQEKSDNKAINIFPIEHGLAISKKLEIQDKKVEDLEAVVEGDNKGSKIAPSQTATVEVLPTTSVRGHKRKVANLTIQSGDLRERQLKFSQSKDHFENGPKKKDETSEKSTEIEAKIEEPLMQKTEISPSSEIPITDLDAMFVNSNHEGTNVPITNLDDSPRTPEDKKEKPHLNLDANQKSAKEGKRSHIPGKQHFCPIKKVDYNEARQFITPKVYFEKPVGLKSVLSPKNKKKVQKRTSVSFSTDDLEKVHMYPSEAAAIEMFDEGHHGEKKELVTNMDDVLSVNPASGSLATYTPSVFSNLEGTLERERQKLEANSMVKVDNVSSIDMTSSYDGAGDLFTESTNSTASAILF